MPPCHGGPPRPQRYLVVTMTAAALPENILSRLSAADRRALGVQSAEEATGKFEQRQEKALQTEIRKLLSFLRAKGECQFINPPMNKRSELPVGWPDFTIFLPGGRTLLIECKAAGGRLRPEQSETSKKMGAMGHKVHVVRSFLEFRELFSPL